MKRIATILFMTIAVLSNIKMQGEQIYEIYPVPHVELAGIGQAQFSSPVTIVAEKGIDEVTVERAMQVLTEHGLIAEVANQPSKNACNLLLGINGSGGVTDKRYTRIYSQPFSLNNKYDRHIVSLTCNKAGLAQVVIVGENTDATFCGLASLEQMLDRGSTLPCVTLLDWADVQNRGIIEGYYGVPYSAAVTTDLFRFMARYKLNTYMYGAKSDPYHSRYWSEPYPTDISAEQERIGYLSQDMMRVITNAAHACKVNFIWAIHPGKAFADPADKDVIDRIMRKLESMYKLGVRQFGVFVDDVGVPSDPAIMQLCADNLTTLQARIDERWNKPGTSPTDKVKPLHYVPQLYAYGWVDLDRGKAFYESLRNTPDKVNIYITGRNVWSVPNNHDLALVQSWLGREVSWWWNYPCNDQDMSKLFVSDTYTNFRDETHIINTERLERSLSGTNTVIINPMQQGELSKIALFGVADYTWNNRAWNNERTWEAAIPAVFGEEFADAFKTVAPHLRYYDNDALDYYAVRYQQSLERGKPTPGALIDQLSKVNTACKKLRDLETSANESHRLLYNDLRPWLLRLQAMTGEAVELLQGHNPAPVDYEHNPDFQFQVLGGMGDAIKLATRIAEPSATVLAPLIRQLRTTKSTTSQ
ncbi:MAG: beta-N-acetylglucosaminidase domain-containing protein [Muribaculaceae bacterium]|nr:beta-N-acetylglucosaminidase domain-containing protein [Muribaculaceae bacterium]